MCRRFCTMAVLKAKDGERAQPTDQKCHARNAIVVHTW
jgi:hypothetical protein